MHIPWQRHRFDYRFCSVMLGKPYDHVGSQSPLSKMVECNNSELQIEYFGDKRSDGYKLPDK